MARQKDLLSRLADAGEEAIQKLAEAPGADRFVGAFNTMRDRMDEMQKRLRGLDVLEKRLDALEKRVDALSGGGRAASRSTGARTTARRSPAAATKQASQDPGAATSGRGRKPGSTGTSAPKRSTPEG